MAVPLNKVPQGLLDFFGIKSGEWGPRELGQVLQPVLELGSWYENGYALECAMTLTAAGIVAADTSAGTIAITATVPADLTPFVVAGNIIVPQTEIWHILEAAVGWSFQAAANQVCEAWWSFRGIQMPSADMLGTNVSHATVARTGGRSMARPYWARPGDTLSVSHNGIAVAGGSVSLFGARLRLIRFAI